MEALEVYGKIDENGKLVIEGTLPMHNKQVRVVLLIEEGEQERKDWMRASITRLNEAYGEGEPEYTLDMIKEPNPKYNPQVF